MCVLAHLILTPVLCGRDGYYPGFSIGSERRGHLPKVTQPLLTAESVSLTTRYLPCSLVHPAYTVASVPQFLLSLQSPEGTEACLEPLPLACSPDPFSLALPIAPSLAPPRDWL